MKFENGLILDKGRVFCGHCQRQIVNMTLIGNESRLDCFECGKAWARPLSEQDLITLVGLDEP